VASVELIGGGAARLERVDDGAFRIAAIT